MDFNQGLDARLITPDAARLLARLRWIRFVRMACDTSAMQKILDKPGFFTMLTEIYKEGYVPCSWDGEYPSGRAVVL